MRGLRDAAAAMLRALPPFRGKGRIGAALGRLLTDSRRGDHAVVRFRLWDGSLVETDLRNEPYSFWTGEYDSGVVRRLLAVLPEGGVALDVGANIGLYTAQLGRGARLRGARVFAFEPVPVNRSLLEAVVRWNGLEETVRIVPAALAAGEGEARLRLVGAAGSETGNAFVVDPALDGSEAADVAARVTTLDRAAAELGIARCDVVKIDVEGFELEFLRGGEELLRHRLPVIYGEFNAFHMERRGCSMRDVAALVRPWGYAFYRQVGRDRFAPVDEPEAGLQHVLLVRADAPPSLLDSLGVLPRPAVRHGSGTG